MFAFFEKHNKICWLITILIAIFIFYISSLSFKPTPSLGWNLKTILYHIIIFFLFSFFLLLSLVQGKKKNLILIAVLIAIIYGISDELHQLFVPGRDCSIKDVLLDSFGILFASFLYLLSLRQRKI